MNRKGFTYIEMIVIIAVFSMLVVSIVVPNLLRHAEKTRENICIVNRSVIEQAEQRYFMDNGIDSASMQTLVDEGYIDSLPQCPSDGIYAWEPGKKQYEADVVCSVHGVVTEAVESGETTTEITPPEGTTTPEAGPVDGKKDKEKKDKEKKNK